MRYVLIVKEQARWWMSVDFEDMNIIKKILYVCWWGLVWVVGAVVFMWIFGQTCVVR